MESNCGSSREQALLIKTAIFTAMGIWASREKLRMIRKVDGKSTSKTREVLGLVRGTQLL